MNPSKPCRGLLVKTLALDNRSVALGLGGVSYDTLVVQLPSFGPQGFLSSFVVAVIEIAVLRSGHSVPMLLWQDLSIFDWLDSIVVMVLVDLFIDRSIDLFMPCRLHCLVYYGRSDLLIDSSIVMSSLGHDVVGGLLSLAHENRYNEKVDLGR